MQADRRVKTCSCGNIMKVTIELPTQGAYMTTEGCYTWIAHWHRYRKDFKLFRSPPTPDDSLNKFRWEYLWSKYESRLPRVVHCNKCHTARRASLFERMIEA